jgi:hypothetical protein
VNGGANTVKGNRILSGPIGVGIVLTGTATGGSVTRVAVCSLGCQIPVEVY